MTNDNTKSTGNVEPSSCVTCQGCHVEFPSRNSMFRHLRNTNGACLKGEAFEDFVKYVKNSSKNKVLMLYGYLPSEKSLLGLSESIENGSNDTSIRNGNDAAQLLWQAVQTVCDMPVQPETKLNRSYGCISRGTDVCAQDNGTGAISEVLMCKVPSLGNKQQFLSKVTSELCSLLPQPSIHGQIAVHDCLEMSPKKFNAEMDVTHRRVEYVLPADFLYEFNDSTESSSSLQSFFDSLPSFGPGVNWESRQVPSQKMLDYFSKLKKLMQRLCTHIEKLNLDNEAAMLEKSFHTKKRRSKNTNSKRKQKKLQGQPEKISEDTVRDEKKNAEPSRNNVNGDGESATTGTSGKNVLRRKRFHNFTPRVMAHEFLAYRRLDRFYHAATVRFDLAGGRPFLVLSLKGDLFLTGQVCRVAGLFLALNRGVVDDDMLDCIFDEDYPHLVPAPPAPTMGMYASEASYTTWEGKSQCILSPRDSDRYPKGFNDAKTVKRVKEWQGVVQGSIAKAWLQKGVDPSTGRLVAEEQWTTEVLEPWAVGAQQKLQHYREWKAVQSKPQGPVETRSPDFCQGPSASQQKILVDTSVPGAYQKVLALLRAADASGLWPSTTPKRQLVMVSENQPASLTMARSIAKSNKEQRGSAYTNSGGASGSFSVGFMPGDLGNSQPRANAVFPELVKAAFELELAICPHRQPGSSTIAVNRNAQFRPHVDSGAGAGQSISLIVGLGDYSGGELMVEGEQMDIRYNPVEFNGWKQRHWTMPFEGERYSLVWFTPRGCEGMKGVDLWK